MQTGPTLTALRDLERHLRKYDARGYNRFIRTSTRAVPALLRELTGADDLPDAPLVEAIDKGLQLLRQAQGLVAVTD